MVARAEEQRRRGAAECVRVRVVDVELGFRGAFVADGVVGAQQQLLTLHHACASYVLHASWASHGGCSCDHERHNPFIFIFRGVNV